MRIGFSTGSIALDDVRRGIQVATHQRVKAIELSALREDELEPLLSSLTELEKSLEPFEHVSFHAPSRRDQLPEAEFVEKLRPVADRGWAIIIHPDIIDDFAVWKSLGRAVCIENMDKRKKVGRTTRQLAAIFDQLPEATFCFDIGHARQVDPTMQEAVALVRSFKPRLRQVHMSYVNSRSRHERLNRESILAFQRLAEMLGTETPIILETPVTREQVENEIDAVEEVFATSLNAR